MNIKIYTSGPNEQANDLVNCIKNNGVCEKTIRIETTNYYNNSAFSINDLIILIALKNEDLDSLIINKEKFLYNRVIIILSNNRNETVNKAYQINPIFIEFLDSNYTKLAEIVNNISRKNTKHLFPPPLANTCDHQGGSL